ncbi:MAG: xanthine dehydrogenase family protein molybdopterin-binding subunit, partial [Janthinobacterium lividum]
MSVTQLPTQQSGGVGAALPRIDAELKVSGLAKYTSDHRFAGMLIAVPVCATIARGAVQRIDTSAAAGMPGVRRIYTHENIGKLYRVSGAPGAQIDEKRPPMEDTLVRYYGQYVALVVADTFEQATAAAARVKVDYRRESANVAKPMKESESGKGELPVVSERGDAAAAFASAAVTVDETYTTPIETHNPIELHATVAQFDGQNFTLHETSQAIVNHKAVMAQMLGVQPENVRVITEYLGSGFGGKLWPWGHSLLGAVAARDLGRPVKLVVTRGMMFHNVGHRTNTQQRIRLSASSDGRLTSLRQDFLFHQGQEGGSKENCGEMTSFLYGTDNLRVSGGPVKRDIAPNTSMRGPGAVPGLFCTESAIDELAIKLGMDPVQFRLQNEPSIDLGMKVPFSSRHLSECLSTGAERFGWGKRTPAVGSMRRADGVVLGWGVAGCSWGAKRVAAQASVALMADGGARVSSAVQDIGTGTYTVLAQMVTELTGIASSKVTVSIGDTRLPPGPFSGGSMAT